MIYIQNMEENKLICPITLELIKIYGITCFGSIYEFDAITKWFENSEKDPLTGLYVPTKRIHKMISNDENEVRRAAEDKLKQTKIWYKPCIYFLDSPKKFNKLNDIKKFIEKTDQKKWKEYVEMKRNRFCNEKSDAFFEKCKN